jgi:hypothetical protein
LNKYKNISQDAEMLSEDAEIFGKKARSMKRREIWKNVKYQALAAFLVIVCLTIIILVACQCA